MYIKYVYIYIYIYCVDTCHPQRAKINMRKVIIKAIGHIMTYSCAALAFSAKDVRGVCNAYADVTCECY